MNNKSKLLTPRGMAKIAILSAVAVILMMFDFPLPFAPSFYQLDFSEVAVLLGGFSMGPMAAVAIEALKIVLNVLFTGSNTAYVGELANFLIGASFTVTASVIYKLNKTRKGAFIGMITGTVFMAVVGCFMNALLLLPMYSVLYQMPMDVLIGMGTALIPAIHDVWTFVLFAVVPFNLVKGVLVSAITSIMYKHVSPILHS
ncbi:MAG: ECF transporter S component [Bulleidia sp.]